MPASRIASFRVLLCGKPRFSGRLQPFLRGAEPAAGPGDCHRDERLVRASGRLRWQLAWPNSRSCARNADPA